MNPRPAKSRRAGWLGGVGIATTLLASACGGGATTASSAPPSTATSAAPGAGTPTTTALRGAPPVAAVGQASSVDLSGAGTGDPAGAAPTEVAIPSVGISSAVVPLGLQADGEASVPTSTTVVGWYDKGPLPGQPGPAVLLGHVDSYTGPGIFYRLRQLRPGAAVTVTEGGRPVTFAVQSVQQFAKAQFPTAAVYGPTPARALRLITCGGAFDRASGHYTDNIVVFANAT